MFHRGEIKENGKYKILSMHFPPNSCQQTNGLIALEIANVSKQDLGQYKCGLQMSGIMLAERHIPFYDFGEHYWEFISNENIGSDCINRGELHLNGRGVYKLACNFREHINGN